MYISKRNKIYNDSKLLERGAPDWIYGLLGIHTCENGHTTEFDRRQKIFLLLFNLLIYICVKVPHNRHCNL